MPDHAWEVSEQLLRLVLAGSTYDAAARSYGMTRTNAERRVKRVVAQLIREGLVPELNERQAIYVGKLRNQRRCIENALQGYSPPVQIKSPQVVPILSPHGMDCAVRKVRSRSGFPERDVAMVMILLATGLRPLEVARLNVGDYLAADGTVRTESVLRAEIATNGQARPLFFASSAAREAIDAYLARRMQEWSVPQGGALGGALGGQEPMTSAAHGCCGDRGPGSRPLAARATSLSWSERAGQMPEASSFRGLQPDAALFLNDAQGRFEVSAVRTASGTRHRCEEIHYAYRRIFRWIACPGLTALTVRHTVVDRLSRRGARQSQIGELLGILEMKRIKRPKIGLDELMHELIELGDPPEA